MSVLDYCCVVHKVKVCDCYGRLPAKLSKLREELASSKHCYKLLDEHREGMVAKIEKLEKVAQAAREFVGSGRNDYAKFKEIEKSLKELGK
jgi:vacuolar-type H+-ATPase subunit D/Vma8